MNNLVTNNIVVLIDQFTKDTVETITYDVLSKHAAVITDIKELSEEHYQSDVVIFEPSFSVIVTPEILEELQRRLEIKVFAVYQEENAVRPLKPYVNCIKCDYSEISWNLIYAIVKKDMAILEPYQRSRKIIDGFKSIKSRIPPDLQEYIDRFRGTYMDLVLNTERILTENAQLKETVQIQETIGRQTIAGLTELKALLDQSQDKVNAYEALLSKDYNQVFTGFYMERPKVLYIKRISHVAGIDNFISVLYATLQSQYKFSVKVIKLVDSANALDMRYIPNNYVAVTGSYNTSDILTNQFILKIGGLQVMYDTLMLNRSGLDILIIHDMKGTMDVSLDPALIDLRINEISADYCILGEYTNVLSSDKKTATYYWNFDEVQKYTGTRVVRLVNHPTIISVLDGLI